jgi:hypothetical protein
MASHRQTRWAREQVWILTVLVVHVSKAKPSKSSDIKMGIYMIYYIYSSADISR